MSAVKQAAKFLLEDGFDIDDARDLLDGLEQVKDALVKAGSNAISVGEAWDDMDEIYIAMSELEDES